MWNCEKIDVKCEIWEVDVKWKTETHDMISVASLFHNLKSTLEHTAHSNFNFGGQLS